MPASTLRRPVPFALSTGNIYEAEKSGVTAGSLEIAYDRHLTAGDTEPIDDGWLAYGPFKAAPKDVPAPKKQSGALPKVVASGGSRPHFGGKTPSGDDSATKTDDKDVENKDPNRPVFHRAPAGSTSTDDTSKTDDSDSNNDAERPTLKRRTPEERKAAQKKKDSAKVVGGTNLNDDPDRPNLHRGKPASRMEEDDLPPLRGIPKDMRQLVAVSDAKDRPEHDFIRPWDSDSEKADILLKMQGFARDQLAAYKGVPAPAAAPVKLATAPVAKTPAARGGSGSGGSEGEESGGGRGSPAGGSD